MTTQSAAGPSIHPSSSDSLTGIGVTQIAPSGLPVVKYFVLDTRSGKAVCSPSAWKRIIERKAARLNEETNVSCYVVVEVAS